MNKIRIDSSDIIDRQEKVEEQVTLRIKIQ